MPINTHELLKAAEIVAENREMKVTLKCSAKGAATVGATTFVGGILGGPLGLLIGSVGGAIAYLYLAKEKFKPMVVILREDLSPTQRCMLADHLHKAIKDLDITDGIQLIAAVSSQEALALVIFTTLKKFIENEYSSEVTYM